MQRTKEVYRFVITLQIILEVSMEKLFELSVVSRKNVTGETYVTVEAESEKGESLGKAVVVVKDEERSGGVYFRYIPNEEANAEESIATVEIKAKDQQVVQEILKQLKEAILEKARNDSNMDFMAKMLCTAYVSCCIDEEAGRISIPKDMEINITNEMIAKYVFDEWIGIEVKISQTIQEKIDKAAEEKRQKEKEQIAELMKAIGEEDNYLKILKRFYSHDEDDE